MFVHKNYFISALWLITVFCMPSYAYSNPNGVSDHTMEMACDYFLNMYEGCGEGGWDLCPGCTDTSDTCLMFLQSYYDNDCVVRCA